MTCLDGRSERTRQLAEQAGGEVTASIEELVGAADIVISVLVPARAVEVAMSVAEALKTTGAEVLSVDANANAPRTVREIGEIVRGAGARIANVAIVGAPPRKPGTRFYTSGPGGGGVRDINGV